MTAAYTNDLITQEQHAEKKMSTTVNNETLCNKKEQTAQEEKTEIGSVEKINLVTGGQDQKEISIDQEKSPLSTPINTPILDKENDEAILECETSSEMTKVAEENEDTVIKLVESDLLLSTADMEHIDVSFDGESIVVKPIPFDTIISPRLNAIFNHLSKSYTQNTILETRGNDSPTKNNFKMEELQDCIKSVTKSTNISNNPDIPNGLLEGADFQNISEEVYDPESELNFHEAVRAGDAKCIAALLARDSIQNLDEPDWNVSGDPPLLVAATNHCLPVLGLLLANGCDPAVRSPRGETALHRVILNGGPGNVLQFVGELLKYGCPSGVKEAGGGLTALHILTRQLAHAQGSKNLHHNFEAALKTLDLLARAGPVNAKDHQGRSALHILASSTIFDNNHRTEIESLIGILLAAGADPSLKNDRGETPLHECLECGALNTALLLVPHTLTGIMSRYGETPLHIACRKNYPDMVAKLLEQGEDPSVQDAGGNTPLHLASARGFHQIVSLLVTSPLAQLEKLNSDGLTALQVAAESGFVNAVKLLLKAGADPSQTVHYCTTTLHRHPDISVLIDHELSRRRQLAA